MSSPDDSVTLKDVYAIEDGFVRALQRLNLDGYQVVVGGTKYPLQAATHHYVFLPRLALRAEELCIMGFGVRLFPNVVYTVKADTASGFEISLIDKLTDAQRQDPNTLQTMSHPVADRDTLTYGLQGLLIDHAIIQCFDIDRENKLLKAKDLNMTIHKTFKQTVDYTEGQCIPLLSAEYLSINEIHGLLRDNAPLRALNAARVKAEELHKQHEARRDRESDMSHGV